MDYQVESTSINFYVEKPFSAREELASWLFQLQHGRGNFECYHL
jgi:hypothetical protein